MKVFRIKHGEKVFYASLDGDHFRSLIAGRTEDNPIPLTECLILPIVVPSKIVCVGLNYREHAEELNMDMEEDPMIFLKPSSAVIGNNDAIVLPSVSEQVDYEGELAVVIGQTIKNVAPDKVAPLIFGYTCANDVTARDFQRKDKLFTRAKGFDSFAPVGPCIKTDLNTASLGIRTIVNGVVRQEGNTSDMIRTPAELISFISHIMTLNPGDVVMTGTPKGIGTLNEGDTVEVEIEGIGKLSNKVIAESPVQ
ncbi:fumarylacetoacetate hydrolase family protein [Maridesulfovibrio sp.]|uniref:fumarylacetoacetate hydrolase family protein n=1 Tax=Maridesulfovibrio sp. TaxID=2795000 RepID=UPI002A1890BE|nr:fumarylacetoacetate hydrolase family protein [Maridesulfovibrio sp.]